MRGEVTIIITILIIIIIIITIIRMIRDELCVRGRA